MALTTYTPIESYTVSNGSTTQVTFGVGGTIPQTYTDLIIVCNIAFNNSDSLSFRFNGDTSSSNLYSYTILSGNGSSALSLRGSNQARGLADYNAYPSSTVGQYTGILQVMDYTNQNTYKTILSRSSQINHGTDAIVNLYRSNSAITSITLGMGSAQTTAFASGSTLTLYGVANSDIGAPLATGGTIVSDSDYYYHVFGMSGTFTPRQNLTTDVLVVAGGGGSGRTGGGGGAGGLRGLTNQALTTTAYTITIGAGGAGSTSDGGIASNGGNSSIAGSGFTTITASGGGGGASYSSGNAIGASGGSGGGGGTHDGNSTTRTGGAGNAGSYFPVEGYSGGSAISNRGSGGGGGAGGAGGNATSNTSPGVGGIGSLSYSSWGLATGTGENVNGIVYFAGGGTGSRYSGGPTLGGYGGGGAGGAYQSGSKNATPNTGGGAGSNNDENGYQGGSGLVIIRYPKA